MSEQASGAPLGGGAGRTLAPGPRSATVIPPSGRPAGHGRGAGRHLVVIGAGITGLAAARAARQQGLRVTVLEAGPRPGGKLALGEVAGVQIDLGAESILARRPEGTDLAAQIGLTDDLTHPATISAGIWSRGRLRTLPAGHLMGVPGDLRALADSGILSEQGVARAQADQTLPPTPVDGDVSVGAFVAARMGREVSDRLVEPLLGGVYAGHAERLSLRATIPQLAPLAAAGTPLGEGVRALLDAAAAARPAGPPPPVFAGLRGGVGRLAVELAAANEADGVDTRFGTAVTSLKQETSTGTAAGSATETGWRLTLSDGTSVTADAVVLAVPAHAAARLLADLAGPAANALTEIEYGSVAIVTLAVPRAELGDAGLPGSGFLVPAVEGRSIKAATFSTAKWPWLADSAGEQDLAVLRASIGRAGETAELDRDDADLVTMVCTDLAAATGLSAAPADTHVQRWTDSLPQYTVGHLDRVARIRAALPAGTAVAGAAYDGVGIPACIASAHAAVHSLTTTWNERPDRP